MDESASMRAKLAKLAAVLDGADYELRSLPASREQFDAHRALAEACDVLRIWRARTSEPQPRRREKHRF